MVIPTFLFFVTIILREASEVVADAVAEADTDAYYSSFGYSSNIGRYPQIYKKIQARKREADAKRLSILKKKDLSISELCAQGPVQVQDWQQKSLDYRNKISWNSLEASYLRERAPTSKHSYV